MAKRLIDGRKNAKGKKYSHRPKRYKNSWYVDSDMHRLWGWTIKRFNVAVS